MLNDVLQRLRGLRLHGMADRLQAWVDSPAHTKRPMLEAVMAMAEAEELVQRTSRKQRLARIAELDPSATMRTVKCGSALGMTDQAWQTLCALDWVDLRHTVILTGPSGTGKTFMASALANHAVDHGRRVAFVRVTDWLDGALIREPVRTDKLLRQLKRAQVVVLDEFTGAKPWTMEQTQDIYRLVEQLTRGEGRALLVCARAPLPEWDGYFEGDLDGIASRLAAKAHLFKLRLPDVAKIVAQETSKPMKRGSASKSTDAITKAALAPRKAVATVTKKTRRAAN